MSTVDIVNNALKRWRDTVIPNERAQHNRPDTNIPLTSARLDMAAYTFSYHMNGGCALEKYCFWGNMHVRETFYLKRRINRRPLFPINDFMCFLQCPPLLLIPISSPFDFSLLQHSFKFESIRT